MQPKLNYCPVCRTELEPTETISYVTQSGFCWLMPGGDASEVSMVRCVFWVALMRP
jgi:hypothetical protein